MCNAFAEYDPHLTHLTSADNKKKLDRVFLASLFNASNIARNVLCGIVKQLSKLSEEWKSSTVG